MRKKEVVEDKSASYKNYEKKKCAMSLSLPRSHIHIFMYIYHMYIWVNLLGTEVIISHTRELTLYSFILLVWNI
jgi:hypothetical protein